MKSENFFLKENLVTQILVLTSIPCQIFHKVNGLAEEIQKLQPPVDLWRKFIYCTSLSGSIIGLVDHMQPQGVVFQYFYSASSCASCTPYSLVDHLHYLFLSHIL